MAKRKKQKKNESHLLHLLVSRHSTVGDRAHGSHRKQTMRASVRSTKLELERSSVRPSQQTGENRKRGWKMEASFDNQQKVWLLILWLLLNEQINRSNQQKFP